MFPKEISGLLQEIPRRFLFPCTGGGVDSISAGSAFFQKIPGRDLALQKILAIYLK